MLPNLETFAQLIERQMKRLDINQVALERRSRIADTTWANWRAGTLPARSLIKTIAETLQVDDAALFDAIENERRARKVGVRVDTVEQAKAWVEDHGSQHDQAERA